MSAYSPRFKQVASSGMLMLAALIWGMCFVAQRSGMEHVGPFLFNGVRELLGALALLIVVLIIWLITRNRTGSTQWSFAGMRQVLVPGVLCGLALYVASNLQQIGMVYVTASKAAFITTLYIVLVPLLGLFLRHRARWNTWVSVAIAVVGLYLLCVGDSLALEFGDIILLVSALFWAVHILAVGHFAPRLLLMQLFGLCVVQFAVAGILSLATAPFADHLFVAATPSIEAIFLVLPEILYAGILSTAGGFTLAALGQRYAKPAPAAVIMSLESAFGLLGGVVLLGEVLTADEGFGCVLMFIAVILAQLEFKRPPKEHAGKDESMAVQTNDP